MYRSHGRGSPVGRAQHARLRQLGTEVNENTPWIGSRPSSGTADSGRGTPVRREGGYVANPNEAARRRRTSATRNRSGGVGQSVSPLRRPPPATHSSGSPNGRKQLKAKAASGPEVIVISSDSDDGSRSPLRRRGEGGAGMRPASPRESGNTSRAGGMRAKAVVPLHRPKLPKKDAIFKTKATIPPVLVDNRYRIGRDDLVRLMYPSCAPHFGWLNDEIINGFFHCLSMASSQPPGTSPQFTDPSSPMMAGGGDFSSQGIAGSIRKAVTERPPVVALSSHFWSILRYLVEGAKGAKEEQQVFRRVIRWVRGVNLAPFSDGDGDEAAAEQPTQLVLIPIHHGDDFLHWSTVIIATNVGTETEVPCGEGVTQTDAEAPHSPRRGRNQLSQEASSGLDESQVPFIRHSMCFCDSLDVDGAPILKVIWRFFRFVAAEASKGEKQLKTNPTASARRRWRFATRRRPQENGFDCGALTCFFAHSVVISSVLEGSFLEERAKVSGEGEDGSVIGPQPLHKWRTRLPSSVKFDSLRFRRSIALTLYRHATTVPAAL